MSSGGCVEAAPDTSARFLGKLLFGALLAAGTLPALARSDCTDADGDGYFRETGCRTAPDCNDQDRRTHPGATETCDGYDNDCDGLLDDAAACPRSCTDPFVVGDAQPVGSRFVCGQEDPDMLWTGSSFGIAWDRYSCASVEFAAVDPFGLQLGPETKLPHLGEHPQTPSMAWTGSEFAVVWNDLRRDVFLTRVDPFGTILGDTARITTDSIAPSGQRVFWTGSEFGIFWIDNRIERGQVISGQLAFARARADGQPFGHTAFATSPGTVFSAPSIIWTGPLYAATYQRPPGQLLTTINTTGHRSRDAILTPNPVVGASLAWTGREIAAAWADARAGVTAIYFARFDLSGRKIGGDVRVTEGSPGSFSPSLAWTGTEFGVSWTDARDGNLEVYFARLDASGTKIGEDLRVTANASRSGPSVLRWTGDAYGIVFTDTRENPEGNVFFTRIGCR